MVKLAHISDPHLTWPQASAVQLLCKRILGYQSWHLNRKKIHQPEILAKLVGDVHVHKPDEIAVTGDLTNIAVASRLTFGRARSARRHAGRPLNRR